MLLEAEQQFSVVGEARDGLEAVELIIGLQPDVALLDLAMPRLPGLGALRELARTANLSRIILLTAAISRQQTVEALRLGARGVILKEAATEVLYRGIRAVMAGEYWVGRESVTDLVRYVRGQGARFTGDRVFGLTPRERQVVSAVVTGLTNKEIARQFSLSEDTVKHHLSSVFDKVGVSTRLELALFALEHGLASGPHD
jgi:DNA-binding NarL/FixJ family response regulator